MMLALALIGYAIAVGIAIFYHEHHRRHHGGRFECIGCAHRRRLVRFAVVLIIGLLILTEGEIRWADLGFIALAIIVELT